MITFGFQAEDELKFHFCDFLDHWNGNAMPELVDQWIERGVSFTSTTLLDWMDHCWDSWMEDQMLDTLSIHYPGEFEIPKEMVGVE